MHRLTENLRQRSLLLVYQLLQFQKVLVRELTRIFDVLFQLLLQNLNVSGARQNCLLFVC